ncbi:hypothetical protein GCM10022221_52450 [Actinocorallia aurea]
MSGKSRDDHWRNHLAAHEAHRAAHLAGREARRAARMAGISALQGWGAPAVPDTGHLRVGDTERNAVADALQEHYAQGRLDSAELDDRLSRALAAKTGADLRGLMDDLPGPHPWEAPVTPQRHAPGYRTRRGPHRLSLALWLFLVVGLPLIFFGGGAVAVFAAVRVLFLVGLVFFVARMFRRARSRR